MGYYWFNWQEIKKKSKKNIFLRKSCWILFTKQKNYKNKERDRYRNLSEEEKNKIKDYQKKKYQELLQYKKQALKNK